MPTCISISSTVLLLRTHRVSGADYALPKHQQYLCIAHQQAREEAAKDTSQAAVIDVTKFGMSKVLGKGQLPQQPVVVRARFVSKLAGGSTTAEIVFAHEVLLIQGTNGQPANAGSLVCLGMQDCECRAVCSNICMYSN